MYKYDQFDDEFITQRIEQLRSQISRRLAGELTEDEFKPLRLQNGVYLQLHAYMLRLAIPYGQLNSTQMRTLAHIARKYDKGFGHFTTRQNIQYNWPALSDIPEILEDLQKVEMHAIQTSGNCIRNTTSDPFAGVAADELTDPRPWCEIIRQWSTLHPEFAFLPRKFKIAVNAAEDDRAAILYHDVALQIVKNDAGEIGFKVYVGGGQGRTPVIAKLVREFLEPQYLLSYLDAILRTYNMIGRRDNMYKARIKITVNETGVKEFTRLVELEWQRIKDTGFNLPDDQKQTIFEHFILPKFESYQYDDAKFETNIADNNGFDYFVKNNTFGHKADGYTIVSISLKPHGGIPGDISADQMDLVAQLADDYSLSEIRATHRQNLVLPHVKLDDLFTLWQKLSKANLAAGNIGLLTDIIACPGLDYCALANARSIPIAQMIAEHFDDLKKLNDLGDITLNISGCINACAHHHVANIGILGVDKKGEESYQVTLGGSSRKDADIGNIIGRGFSGDEIVGAIDTITKVYLAGRKNQAENFLAYYRRAGQTPFKEALYNVT
ncbi:MAG: nitrite/sulfite reductase [Rhizobiales bacterium]|nr:nitrite/sulfite reductase [Hyphomicrobiales bacterium]NRB13783.1 nitrite/sulfite reductase [Hyphomicrobiales bacterium]